MINKPQQHQRPDWTTVYIDKVADGYAMDQLSAGLAQMISYAEALTEEQLLYAYDHDKWTVKEVLVHIMDVERVFYYRAMRAARKDETPMPGFDHNAYVPNSNANQRSKESLLAEYKALRLSTIEFFKNLDEASLDFVGNANGQPCSAKAMLYMIAGHEQHHFNILKERYFSS